MKRWMVGSSVLIISAGLLGQDVQSLLQGLKSAASSSGLSGSMGGADALPGRGSSLLDLTQDPMQQQQQLEDLRLDDEIKQMKARETGPKRFASDLFDLRQRGSAATDGGVSEDYALGTGDRLGISSFGSAAFDLPVQVDGRGMVIIPKLGAIKVGGLSLGQARELIQSKVRKQFSNSTVDVQAIKLREVRVHIVGEVYKPGAFLVSSLSNLVNVLSLSGGPTAIGSYRQIKVVRGGKVVHTLDLYPLRADGRGEINFYLQSGDTIFVPIASNLVTLEGAFTRVVAAATRDQDDQVSQGTDEFSRASKKERIVRRQIQQLEAILAKAAPVPSDFASLQPPPLSVGTSGMSLLQAPGAAQTPQGTQVTPIGPQSLDAVSGSQGKTSQRSTAVQSNTMAALLGGLSGGPSQASGQASSYSMQDIEALQSQLDDLRERLREIQASARVDRRIQDPDAVIDEDSGTPNWLRRWNVNGVAPVMQFEMLPGETAQDALRFAGGVDMQGFSSRLTIRRMEASGAWTGIDVPIGDGKASPELQRGDVLQALPRRDWTSKLVQVAGWVRATGNFSRTDGLRVGDLLKRENAILPDTYLGRGEITRTLPDGTSRFLSFDVTKALAGDESHNLLLEDRDRIDLYRTDDLRLNKRLTVTGPVQRPGMYEYLEGMRASDLLFRAGLPLQSADRFVAELGHFRDSKKIEAKRLDLTKLLSSDKSSPVDLKDDEINPLLEPNDQLNVYEQPNYKPMKIITLSGEVRRPGQYVLESNQTTLREVVQRAGGLTPEAMPEAAIFLRTMWGVDPAKAKMAREVGKDLTDPTANGINETLGRLNESLRNPLSGVLLTNPLLHGLQSGSLSRLVVDIPKLLAGDKKQEIELQDGDEVVFPMRTNSAYVVGETASPFAAYQVHGGATVSDLLKRAGGVTRNADRGGIRLLKANGQILDSWVSFRKVEPGDAVLVPQRIRKDVSWQENLAALTPLAIMVNALKK